MTAAASFPTPGQLQLRLGLVFARAGPLLPGGAIWKRSNWQRRGVEQW